MEIAFEAMLAVAYLCAGTACAGIVITKVTATGEPVNDVVAAVAQARHDTTTPPAVR